MVRLLKDETLVTQWKDFFEKNYKREIETVALTYPDECSIDIEFETLDKHNQELAEKLHDLPYKSIFNAEIALKEIDTASGNIPLHLRVKNLHEIYSCIPPNKLRTRDMGQLISVEGFVKNTTPVRPKTTVGAFQCGKCGVVIRVEQNDLFLTEPKECYENQSGCGRAASFTFSKNLSTSVDFQKLKIQEPPEDVKRGEQPEKLIAHLEDDLVHSVVPGDRVVLTGILQMQPKRINNRISTVNETYLEVNHVDVKQTVYASVDWTDGDENKINKSK